MATALKGDFMIGYVFCGSHCTVGTSINVLQTIVDKYGDVCPIVSENVYHTDTRFGKARDIIERIEKICSRKVIHTIVDAEPLGPKIILDSMIVAPCTGNTLAKIALGITDTAATMAIKAHLRSSRKTLIALATNDAMSSNLANIGTMLNKKSVYFVPMIQDSPSSKPHSLVADFSRLVDAYELMMRSEQIRPLFV